MHDCKNLLLGSHVCLQLTSHFCNWHQASKSHIIQFWSLEVGPCEAHRKKVTRWSTLFFISYSWHSCGKTLWTSLATAQAVHDTLCSGVFDSIPGSTWQNFKAPVQFRSLNVRVTWDSACELASGIKHTGLVALHLFSVAWILVFPGSWGSECFTGQFLPVSASQS